MTSRLPFALCALLSLSASLSYGQSKGRILIVAANGAEDKNAPLQARSSLWESAPAYHVFKIHGYEVDFLSPQGGAIRFGMDEDEVDPTPLVHYTIRYEGFRERADRSLSADKLDPKQYKAAFIGGGAGPMLALAKDPAIQKVLGAIYQNKGVLGSCGHGAAALTFVQLAGGDYLVKGKKVTGFPNASEVNSKWTQGGKLLPFLLEDALVKNGALFQGKGDLKGKFDALIDQRLVTGMFLGSCAAVAKEVVNALP